MRQKIPTIAVLIFLMIGVIAGVALVQEQQYFRLSASGEMTPHDVRITNITDSSFNVSFTTAKKTIASVSYGDQDEQALQVAYDKNTSLSQIHYFSIRELEPDTNYRFTINVSGDEYLNAGIPWAATTATSSQEKSSGSIFAGRVLTDQSTPAKDGVVYIQIGGVSPLSAKISENGVWFLPLNDVRTQNLQQLASIADNQIVNIFVQGENQQIATVKIKAATAHATPDIVLGSSYDFLDSTTQESKTIPSAEIQLPEDTQPSRFELSDTPPR